MATKRYDHNQGALVEKRGHGGRMLPDGVTMEDAKDELYTRLGGRFKVDWEPWADAEPIVYTNTLPDGVAEADVETALKNMEMDGVL